MKETLHQINIITHITFGSLAILVGFWPLVSEKGKRIHNLSGRIYLCCVGVVLLTALCGALFFEFRPFLFLLTVMVFYTSFVGYRTLKLKERRPTFIDGFVQFLGLITVLAYFFVFDIDKAAMSKPVVYFTSVILLAHVIYDFGKYFYSTEYLRKSWLNDHIIRIISSFGGLICAAAGNVLDESYQPYSQLVPSVVGYLLIAYFVYKYRYYLRPKL
ncbi:hypothetical protein [Arcticibacterium luteifluviistationis]|uniref:DUF2306 domain-containing protein n=1 Tax=Arcticibacterium luteifluviistationis TaxID=1784714 RepID=A0A2Z4GEY4_9BACT|nr:hypothetical protein [Arcticibacterium luteifluviistationis]AWV99919.1 hypothetical protein DJ013_17775 [Arcticibacterium luteifluviistationis]